MPPAGAGSAASWNAAPPRSSGTGRSGSSSSSGPGGQPLAGLPSQTTHLVCALHGGGRWPFLFEQLNVGDTSSVIGLCVSMLFGRFVSASMVTGRRSRLLVAVLSFNLKVCIAGRWRGPAAAAAAGSIRLARSRRGPRLLQLAPAVFPAAWQPVYRAAGPHVARSRRATIWCTQKQTPVRGNLARWSSRDSPQRTILHLIITNTITVKGREVLSKPTTCTKADFEVDRPVSSEQQPPPARFCWRNQQQPGSHS